MGVFCAIHCGLQRGGRGVGMALAVAAAAAGGAVGGCAVPTEPATFTVSEGRLQDAIDATRAVLREYRFELDRIDAGEGVVSSQPKETAGAVSFWEPDQSTLKAEWDDLANRHARQVRVSFEPTGRDGAGSGAAQHDPERVPTDARDGGERTGVVEVTLLRYRRPGWKLETEAVAWSAHAVDPELRRGVGAEFWSPVRRDDELAARLARDIRERLAVVPPG